MTKMTRNPVAWVQYLHEAGTIRQREQEAADAMASIARYEEQIRALRANLRRLAKRTEEEARALGWTAAQIEAAKRGEVLA